MKKVTFYGDSYELKPHHPVMVFIKGEYATVCDWSECGMYVAGGCIKDGERPVEVKVEELFRMFPLDVEVDAWNNGIACFFRRNNIKTLRDLYEHFLSLLSARPSPTLPVF
jgi:hypothetical protein